MTDAQRPERVPARRRDSEGRPRVDNRAILALALPLMANSGAQLLLNLTDAWFIGRISTEALAAVGAVQWLSMVVLVTLAGVGIAVQTVVAQAQGARRHARASQAVWTALWALLMAAPLFLAAGLSLRFLLRPFSLPAHLVDLAAAFWLPRVSGSILGAAVWAILGFFNGIGRPGVTLLVTLVMALANALFNELFIFHLQLGIAGSGLATTAAQACGLAAAMCVFLRRYYRSHYRSHLTWSPRLARIAAQFRLGLPMGLMWAADLIGFALFQIMQVRLGAGQGAATQIVMVMTALSYMPGIGIAMAGTTLVGQAIGAGDRAWARVLGNRIIAMTALYMGGMGLVLALSGPLLLPQFLGAQDAQAAAVVALAARLLWIAALYQFFDGLNLSGGFCLRGAGDATVPATLTLLCSWVVFVPLAYVMTFAPGQGWLDFLPQLGWGATGGWFAVVIYTMLVGSVMLWRWRSLSWERLRL